MQIQLSDHFTYNRLLRFIFPSIVMMIFTSIYGVVDGLFVSNFVGKTSFAAVNLLMPFLMILGSLGFMVGAGGSAIVAKTLGEGKNEKAKEYFSLMVYVTIIGGIIMSIIGVIWIEPISKALGAQGEILQYCITYGRIILPAMTAFLLQNVFQSFLVTAEKPHLGLGIIVAAGITNMCLDFLFIAVFKWGIAGAAAATAISQCIGGIIPLIYFILPNKSNLRLRKTKFDGRILLNTCTNGSSELMTNISMSLVGILYNIQLMKLAGENGIAAYGAIMYVAFIFAAVFIGYSIGSAPIIGYNYGAKNDSELKNVFKKSLIIIGTFGVILTIVAELSAFSLAKVFVGYDAELLEMTYRGFAIYSVSFLFCGFSIWSSSFFTALNNGVISAAISFLRTLVFEVVSVLVLPMFFGIYGIWSSVIMAEMMAILVTIIFLIKLRKRYGYF